MKKIKFISLGLILAIAISACSKEELKIGRNNPQAEIQKCMKLSEDKQFEEAVECLEIFKSRFPRTQFSTQAEISIGDNYFKQKEYLLAADSYMMFTRLHPRSPSIDYAYYMLGLSYLKETPKAIDRDQQYLDEAIYYLTIAVKRFPKSKYRNDAVRDLKDARTRVAERTYYIGNFYYRTGEYKSAIPRFIDVINDYPETHIVPKSLYKLVVSAGKMQQVEDAKLFYSKLEIHHPDSKWTKKAEEKLGKYIKKYGDKATEDTQ